MSKEGIPIDDFDPKPAIKRNAENARDWEFSDDAKYLYGMTVLFLDRLIDPIARIERSQMPDPVISFDDLRNKKTLAAYTINRNAQGLWDEITFNTAHYIEKDGKKVWGLGRWAQLETLLHEQIHLWQQRVGENPVKPGRSHHNKEFVEKCESLGLHPMPDKGYHVAVADGVFAQFRPEDVPRISGNNKIDWFRPTPEKGKSTLHKWVCPDCGLAVRMGVNSDPHLVHDVCSEIKGEKVFLVRHDGLQNTIYDAEDENGESPKNTPEIIEEINEYLKEGFPEDTKKFTMEGIAEEVGISKSILCACLKSDSEFTTALERLRDVQKNDPFKTGIEEDTYINSMMIAFLLIETRDRHYKSHN